MVGKPRIVRFFLALFGSTTRSTAISVFADNLEEGHWDEAARVGKQGIAGFPPVVVLLSAYNMEKVTLAEG